MEFESSVKYGTRVVLSFPVEKTTSAKGGVMIVNLVPSHPVIIIDDEESILLSVDTTLRMAGLNHILSCQDSRQARAMIEAHHAEVILLDLTMPHISGRDLLVEIAADFPEIPVIIITVEIDTNTAVDCIKKGAFDYLVKPVDAKRLVTTVMNAWHFSETTAGKSGIEKQYAEFGR